MRKAALLGVCALFAQGAAFANEAESLVIPSEEEHPFQTDGTFPAADLATSFLGAIPVKISAALTSHQKDGLGIFVQDGPDLLDRGRGRGAAPVGTILLTAVAAFKANPFRNDKFLGVEG